MKKLVLKKETVRALQDTDLRLVVGGRRDPAFEAARAGLVPGMGVAGVGARRAPTIDIDHDVIISYTPTCSCPVWAEAKAAY